MSVAWVSLQLSFDVDVVLTVHVQRPCYILCHWTAGHFIWSVRELLAARAAISLVGLEAFLSRHHLLGLSISGYCLSRRRCSCRLHLTLDRLGISRCCHLYLPLPRLRHCSCLDLTLHRLILGSCEFDSNSLIGWLSVRSVLPRLCHVLLVQLLWLLRLLLLCDEANLDSGIFVIVKAHLAIVLIVVLMFK